MEPVELKGAHQSAVGTPTFYDALARRYEYRAAFVRPRYFWYEVVLILLIGLVLRAWNLGGASLWTDEALTALRAQARITQSLDSLFSAGNQAPLYFLSLQFLPSYSEAMLRMPSVLMGLIGIAFIMFVAVRLYGNYDVALWAGALLAVNPYHVLLSRTARPYALMFVLALAASYLFLLLMRQPRSRVLWGSFILTNVIGYLTHYTFLALAAASAAPGGLAVKLVQKAVQMGRGALSALAAYCARTGNCQQIINEVNESYSTGGAGAAGGAGTASTAARGAQQAARALDPNKLHHIFGKASHNLGPLVQRFGTQEATFRAVESATQAAVRSQGLTGVFETTVNVAGQNVVVRGNVMEGVARVGTFFIP